MKFPLIALATLCLASPALADEQPLACAQPAPVFNDAGSSPLDLSHLSQTVGAAELDGQSLDAVAEQIREDYPDATDAEVADIMITAFCSYLNTDAPADHRSASNVQAFEEQAYDAVFGGTPPESYSRQGWLYGN